MTRTLDISKKELEKLYLNQKLSSHKIGELYNCCHSTILSKLKKFQIERRKPKLKINITKQRLEELYLKQKLSTYKIAKLYNCKSVTILNKLRESKIQTRALKRIFISKEKLEELYLKRKLSLSEISKEFNCNPVTIFKKMNRYKIQLRKNADAHFVYPKHDFSDNNEEKAYMIGFRIGDLHVSLEGRFIRINCSTTKIEQAELIKQVFNQYGNMWIGKPNKVGAFGVECTLNQSFNFLLKKEDRIPQWIFRNKNYFYAFLAGYTDAEGNIGIYSERARFRLGSYDYGILEDIHKQLALLNINSKFRLETPKGWNRQKEDFWRVSVNEKESLLRVLLKIKPYLRHEKRLSDCDKAVKNLKIRIGV